MVVSQVQRPPASPTASARFGLDGPVRLDRSGLRFSRVVSFQKWELIGRQLLAISDSSTWWIADWLVYGESTFQERYPEAIRQTSLNYQTLRNYVWVARRFDPDRRREALSFGHHAEVAALDESEQDYWLRRAEELQWSRNQLRREIRASHVERHGTPPPTVHNGHPASTAVAAHADNALSLRVTADQLEQFTAAARSRDLDLDQWAIQVLDAAADARGRGQSRGSGGVVDR